MRTNGFWQRSATGLMGAGLALAIAIGAAGCKHNPTVAAQDNSGVDPADANLAPVDGSTQVLSAQQQAQPTQQGTDYEQQTPAPVVRQAPSYYPGDAAQGAPPPDASYATDVDNRQQALEEADQAPPPLPDYDQPPAPDPDYLWTPGYWAWSPGGYYWVPGCWVAAPYPGALWTPGYWGFYGGRYRFYHGYWGLHIGFYGGINYGFGYIGTGFYGGYWNGGHFFYNSAVTRVNVSVIHNVYQRSAPPPTYARTGVSFNGGNGGIAARPRPTEVAAMHEQHTPAMAAQVQNGQAAAQNRAQFFNQNHGRPAMTVAARPLPADRNITPPARIAPRSGAVPAIQQQQRGPQPQRAPQVQPQPQAQQNPQQPRSFQQQPAQVAPRSGAVPAIQQQQRGPQSQRAPQVQPQPQPQQNPQQQRGFQQQPARPLPQRGAPQVQPQPQPQQNPQQQRGFQQQPARPLPQQAPAPRPAPAPRAAPQSAPRQAPHPAPAPHEEKK